MNRILKERDLHKREASILPSSALAALARTASAGLSLQAEAAGGGEARHRLAALEDEEMLTDGGEGTDDEAGQDSDPQATRRAAQTELQAMHGAASEQWAAAERPGG